MEKLIDIISGNLESMQVIKIIEVGVQAADKTNKRTKMSQKLRGVSYETI